VGEVHLPGGTFLKGLTASLTYYTFKLPKRKADDATPVSATVSYDVPSKSAILDPDDNLDRDATYIARIIKIGVKDLAGNLLAAAEGWKFTTQK
jgi:hypothetical protein